MSGQEMLQLYATLAAWGLMLLGAIKVFGIRRVLWAIAFLVFLAVVVAFKSLGAITGQRRY